MTEYNTEFKEIECGKCGFKGKPVPTGKVSEMHGYLLECPNCNEKWGWGGKQGIKSPNGERKKSSRWAPHRVGVDSCQLCLRPRDCLGKQETLEPHHVVEIVDGGEDVPSNIWYVCTACHKSIHYRRTYYYDHLKPFFDAKRLLGSIRDRYPTIWEAVANEP